MENLESPKEENLLEKVEEIISRAPERTEEEFSRTANSWLACFGSSVFQVEMYLEAIRRKNLISEEKYREAEKKMEILKEKLFALKQEYPGKETVMPDRVKRELLKELDIFERKE